MVCAQLLLVSSADLWIPRRPTQPLARESYVVSGAEVSILGVEVDAISTDALGATVLLLFILPGLCNQILGLIVWIPANPMQEGKPLRTETLIYRKRKPFGLGRQTQLQLLPCREP